LCGEDGRMSLAEEEVSASPDSGNAIRIEGRVGAYQVKPIRQGLSSQQAVERVLMVKRQRDHVRGVPHANRQRLEI
jgi:hypothetical protein